jgi:signal transduction histidine kinase
VITGDEIAFQSMISFSVLGALCAACALFFMSLMEKVIRHLQKVNAELEGYKANLERRVEERTKTIQAQAQELAEALEAQKQANILQNTLVSVVSHEIRTPLAIIDGHARRMARGAEKMSPEDIADRATTVQKSVKRLTQLIERTLESARYAEGAIAFQPRPFDIRSLLDDIVSREQEQTTTHRLRADLGDLPETYCGDPNLLDHVFSNIISNAIKYAPEAPDVYIRAETENNAVVVRVRDCGVGIPASELSTISNRFFRASTAKGINGTGIGLFLTRRITEDHGGTLSIDSVEGEWTEVTARLPIVSAVCVASDCCDDGLAA